MRAEGESTEPECLLRVSIGSTGDRRRCPLDLQLRTFGVRLPLMSHVAQRAGVDGRQPPRTVLPSALVSSNSCRRALGLEIL